MSEDPVQALADALRKFVEAMIARGTIGGHGDLTVASGNLTEALRNALAAKRKSREPARDTGEAA